MHNYNIIDNLEKMLMEYRNNNFDLASKQTFALFSLFFEIDYKYWLGIWKGAHSTDLENICNQFYDQIFLSRYGYSKVKIFTQPEIELKILYFGTKIGLSKKNTLNDLPFGIFLTHDIDHLKLTWITWAKQIVSRKRWVSPPLKSENYLKNIKELLEFDKTFAGSNIICYAFFSGSLYRSYNLKEIIIDPSYTENHFLFNSLIQILIENNVEIGIHGGINSLEKKLISNQIASMSCFLNKKILHSRQHWLHLPTPMQSLTQLNQAGIITDSTLGWNTGPGFRCGFSRPFPILLPSQKIIWELPMVIMDRALYGNTTNHELAFEYAKKILNSVRETNGKVCLNWHEAATSNTYNWFGSYEKILKWAKAEGFTFLDIKKSIDLNFESKLDFNNQFID